MKKLRGVTIVGIIAFLLTSSNSCMMMHNMSMPMEDNIEKMDDSQMHALGIDPVCGMQTDTSAALVFNYEGNTYYFDSEECLKVFQKNPRKFSKKNMTGGKKQSKNRSNRTLIIGGVAMAAMMAVMMTVMLGGGF